MVKIKVNLRERSYDIIIGAENFAELGKIIQEYHSGGEIIVITDPLVNKLYGNLLQKNLPGKIKTIEVPRGERNKNLKQAMKIYDALVECFAHRDSLIIALGGGVVGDIAGFAAATYMRGINYVQVPTTLLAQVDSSIGGKTGVNHPKCKNLIGSFYQPKLVFIDVKTLTSLPVRELRTGLAEVVKYGVIEDEAFFKFLEENAHQLNTVAFENETTLRGALKLWQTIIAESAKIKARIVEKDETESNLRMLLNYGHTVGHALETLTSYKSYNHGEAVAVGMVASARIASRLKILDNAAVERIIELLGKLGLPTEIEGLSAEKIVSALGIDKKARGGKICFVLPEKIGKMAIRCDISEKIIRESLRDMGAK